MISNAVWLYMRFPLKFRDTKELLAERGLRVSYEIVRRWVVRFGPHYIPELSGGVRPVRSVALDWVCTVTLASAGFQAG